MSLFVFYRMNKEYCTFLIDSLTFLSIAQPIYIIVSHYIVLYLNWQSNYVLLTISFD